MALERLLDLTGSVAPADALYGDTRFPEPPADRPYAYLNMVATVDGKTLQGPIGSTAKGLGGPTDQLLMRRLQEHADGAIVGSGTLRAGPVVYPPRLWRAVVTSRGGLPLQNRFFTDAAGKAIVVAPGSLPREQRTALESAGVILLLVGDESVDLVEAVRTLKQQFGIRYLVLEGGATLNYDFYAAGLVDELFLTIAPKIKGGADLPTVVDGPGLPGREVVPLTLLSLYRDGDELYVRYRTRAADT